MLLEIEVEVDYRWVPRRRGSEFEPPDGGFAEDLRVSFDGVDITDHLSHGQFEEIERQIEESANARPYSWGWARADASLTPPTNAEPPNRLPGREE